MKAFQNVMGYDSLKQELIEIIDVMKNPEAYESLGATTPNGLLLYGEPGLGKTLIANAFIEASGRYAVICRKNATQQSFIDSICEAFDEALTNAPSIILLDDMDKFANDDDDHKDSEAYVTIQTCIDLVKGSGVFVLATANNIRKLPDSLIRTGRFDRSIRLDEPTEDDSQLIIKHYLGNTKLGESLDVDALSALFRGCSCSTLETIINQAAMLAGYCRRDAISMEDMIQSYLMIRHHVSKDHLTASKHIDIRADDGSVDTLWHEAGHLVMGELLAPGSVPIAIATAKVGARHGFVASILEGIPLDDLGKAKVRIMIGMASAAAMDITFGRIDPGAENDIEKALRMISHFNEDLGGFAGLSLATHTCTSSDLDARREIANSAVAELYFQEAKELLCKNRRFLEAVVQAFAEKVVLTAQDIASIKAGLVGSN